MKHMQGIIYTLQSPPELGSLVAKRNAASLPFCGRYRLIDFILSGMVNAGVADVGVVMERDYQSLLDHLGSGKDWNLSRHSGGLRLLPPFSLPDSFGHFEGCMEALRSVRSYIEDSPHDDVILSGGDLVANIDLSAAAELHRRSGARMTAVCADGAPHYPHHRFLPDGEGFSSRVLSTGGGAGEGLLSLEVYILQKSLLLELMDYCGSTGKTHFHRDALAHYLAAGGRVALFRHGGYARRIQSALDYYEASLDMLRRGCMEDLFPDDRPIRTKGRAEVSTYYGEEAIVKNSLIADGCYIEGELENCILFRGVRVEKGSCLRNCIILQDSVIGRDSDLFAVIADKDVSVSSGITLVGSERLPILIPKGASI